MRNKFVVVALASMLLLSNSVNVFAKEQTDDVMRVNLSKTGITVDSDQEIEEDYAGQYAYDGIDYVYAQATFGKNQFAIKRSEFGKLMTCAYKYGTPEENFVAYRESTEIDDVDSVVNEPVLPEKDSRTPWNEWTQEQWSSYEEWVKDFAPDDYQRELLSYYSATEIFAYYMGYGYTIDEVAFTDYLNHKKASETPSEPTGDSTVSENTVDKNSAISYTRLIIRYELDSMYCRESVFCVTQDSMEDMLKALQEFENWTGNEDITNPNAYQAGKYFFEVGTLDEHITDIESIDKSIGSKAYKFLKENNEDLALLDKTDLNEDYYKIKVCVLQKNKPISVEMLVKKNVAMTLLSKYLPSSSEDLSPVKNEQVADNAKG